MSEMNAIFYGDCVDAIKQLPPESVDCVVTSPPYAQQRKSQYGGVDPSDYPDFTVSWMAPLKRVLKPQGSVAIVIRPHITKGEISDYVLRTRLAVRNDGWIECEELIWIKPDSPPQGSLQRPRRSWESILWFGMQGSVYCDPKANGRPSARVGFVSKKQCALHNKPVREVKEGFARCRDYCEIGTSQNDQNNIHPAQYPIPLAKWLIRMLSPEGGVVFDPFLGSGTTAIAAIEEGREWCGSEIQPEYVDLACKRLMPAGKVQASLPFELT